jgi:hypothetical protein
MGLCVNEDHHCIKNKQAGRKKSGTDKMVRIIVYNRRAVQANHFTLPQSGRTYVYFTCGSKKV